MVTQPTRETFTERFQRLTSDLTDSDLMTILNLSYQAVRKLRAGGTQSIKLDAALRLCRRLAISPWELAGEKEPSDGGGTVSAFSSGKTLTFIKVRRLRIVSSNSARLDDLQARLEAVESEIAHLHQGIGLNDARLARGFELLACTIGLPDETIQRLTGELL
jgi:DNA-binding Xre family transcriptional regulator